MVARDRLSMAFAASADPTRRDILMRLRRHSLTVSDLAERYPISRIAVSTRLFEPVIDQHATWMVADPVQGCPKDCSYCHLQALGQTRAPPAVLATPEETAKQLLAHRYYHPELALALYTCTDALATSATRAQRAGTPLADPARLLHSDTPTAPPKPSAWPEPPDSTTPTPTPTPPAHRYRLAEVDPLPERHPGAGCGGTVLAAYQQCPFTPDYWCNYTVIGDAGRLENFGDGPGGEVRG
ncbi:winged helix-turn-helix domain-containing protein [Streptomyces sp. SHP 1-2]|uniref:winged helix-turn-helix domain-containing protein n=1 Tax=Streptomyces sp. SHP 1-2 TaxID=2769489 RepID=UPI0039E0CD20